MGDSIGYRYNKHTGDNMDTMIKATNPYSNESAMFDEDYNTMQKKLSKFSRLNASAYMVLLD